MTYLDLVSHLPQFVYTLQHQLLLVLATANPKTTITSITTTNDIIDTTTSERIASEQNWVVVVAEM